MSLALAGAASQAHQDRGHLLTREGVPDVRALAEIAHDPAEAHRDRRPP